MVIYLKHPVHGFKVACSEFEAEEDRRNGWEDHDPEAKPVKAPKAPKEPVTPVESVAPEVSVAPVEPVAPEVSVAPTDLPAFLAPAPAPTEEKPKGRGGRPKK